MAKSLRAVLFLVGMTCMCLVGQEGWAQYPNKPITFIMPIGAGGSTDVACRPLVTAASKILGQPINMDYHPGGSFAVGMGVLKGKAPDGYTIGMTAASAIINEHMRKVNYNTQKDFTQVMNYGVGAFGFVVRADSPWKTLPEFLAYVKAHPGTIRYSSSGPGDTASLIFRALSNKLQLKMTEIPFEGGPPAVAALLGNHVEALTGTMLSKPHIQAGTLRLLATYGAKRVPSFPDAPTLVDLGYDLVVPSAFWVLGPKGLPPQIVETLHQAFKKAMDDPDFIKASETVDYLLQYLGPQDTAKNIDRISRVVEEALQKK